jgi:hypothetical protein
VTIGLAPVGSGNKSKDFIQGDVNRENTMPRKTQTQPTKVLSQADILQYWGSQYRKAKTIGDEARSSTAYMAMIKLSPPSQGSLQ